MKGQIWFMYLFIVVFIVLVDLYVYRGISQLTQNMGARATGWIRGAYIGLSAAGLVVLTWLFLSRGKYSHEEFFRHISAFFGFFVLFYVPKLLFLVALLFKDLADLLIRLWNNFQAEVPIVGDNGMSISRTDFILKIGLVLSMIPFFSILHGIFLGKYNFRVSRVPLAFQNLPQAFDGMRIVQISDLHLGSFGTDTSEIERAVQIINNLDADYIVFTGDMVNNRSLEMEPFIPVLKKLTAKYGKFSILGNHDYGTYYQWNTENEYRENMEKLYKFHSETGFQLLRNEKVKLERNMQTIVLAGVENWGIPPFPQYGDIDKALSGVGPDDFTILLSHDPSHWDAEIIPKTQVELTLSGHTHGMQFAINIPGWKWSPVKMKYPRWSGLYREGNQHLYVNIGLGFIAFPGRVGTPPEITEFIFSKA